MAVATSVQVVVTDVAGVMTAAAFLPVVNGGLGFSYTPTTADVAKVLQVNQTGTALTLQVVPAPGDLKMYQWNHFL